jgi:23S rRNA (pseudouridine1915-N3)-methyltransferase
LGLALVAVGHLKDGPELDLVRRYAERIAPLARNLGFGPFDMVELPESRARRDRDRRHEEARALLARCATGRLVAFDEGGASVTSPAFARRVAVWRDAGEHNLQFVIGGPDGLDESVRLRADVNLCFGAMTLPHQLVRVLVVEQLYRAMTILAGHPYHRS